MKNRNESLTEIMLKYNMDKVAAKLLNIPRHTPLELGRALHSKLRLVKKDNIDLLLKKGA